MADLCAHFLRASYSAISFGAYLFCLLSLILFCSFYVPSCCKHLSDSDWNHNMLC